MILGWVCFFWYFGVVYLSDGCGGGGNSSDGGDGDGDGDGGSVDILEVVQFSSRSWYDVHE